MTYDIAGEGTAGPVMLLAYLSHGEGFSDCYPTDTETDTNEKTFTTKPKV